LRKNQEATAQPELFAKRFVGCPGAKPGNEKTSPEQKGEPVSEAGSAETEARWHRFCPQKTGSCDETQK
jgi:hypothetical protein